MTIAFFVTLIYSILMTALYVGALLDYNPSFEAYRKKRETNKALKAWVKTKRKTF